MRMGRQPSTISAGILVAILALGGCGPSSAPVTATKVLDVPGLRGNVFAVAIAPDGNMVVTGAGDGHITAYEVSSGAERWKARVHPPGAARRLDTIVFSPDGSFLVSAGDDAKTVELWEAATGRQTGVIAIYNVWAAVFHPAERSLVLGAAGTIHVVDTERGAVARAVPNAHLGDTVRAAAFSSDGRVLATVSSEGSLKLWDWPALTLRASLSLPSWPEPLWPVSLALTREGKRVAANGLRGRVHVWDGAKGREERTFTNTPKAPGQWGGEMRRSLAFTADGDWLLAPEMHDQGMRILHVPSGKTYGVIPGEARYYRAVAITDSARAVALLHAAKDEGGGPHGLQVWRLEYRTK